MHNWAPAYSSCENFIGTHILRWEGFAVITRGPDANLSRQENCYDISGTCEVSESCIQDWRADNRNAYAHMGMKKRSAYERVVELLRLVGLDEKVIDSYPHELSGGMKQRAMIAMAISCDPDLIIADEPTTALDVTLQVQILALLKNSKI